MSTTCTKHRRQADPSDRRSSDAVAEMPVRRSKQVTEAHSILLGTKGDAGRFVTLKGSDYSAKVKDTAQEQVDRDRQRERITDMNSRHFVLGHTNVPMQSELRGSLLPPSQEVLVQRSARPIGGPNNKGASNLYISHAEKQKWTESLLSTNRQDFSFSKGAQQSQSHNDAKNHIQVMRSSHFAIGSDAPEWVSTSRQDYGLPPAEQTRPPVVPRTTSYVPLASGPVDTHKPACNGYGTGVQEASLYTSKPLPRVDLRRSNMVLGYHPPDFTTESMNNFKKSRGGGEEMTEAPEKLSVGWWDRAWEGGRTGWKEAEAGEALPFEDNLSMIATILKEDSLKENGHAFVPLCGDSKVVPYLAMKGMKVTCVEGSELALKGLREVINTIPEEAQKRITIIEDDLFKAELPAESVDFIYDRGSLVAIDPAMREEYFNVIQKVSKPGTMCYLEGIVRSPDFCEGNVEMGPPHQMTVAITGNLYEGWSVGVEEGEMDRVEATLAAGEQHAVCKMGLKRL